MVIALLHGLSSLSLHVARRTLQSPLAAGEGTCSRLTAKSSDLSLYQQEQRKGEVVVAMVLQRAVAFGHRSVGFKNGKN